MIRSVFRFVSHTIRHVPEGGVIYEAPQDNQNAAQDWCLRHTGCTGHDLFRRVVTDHARVARNE
ncbi:hypothetical protein SUDANB145_04970 [Streptomyces sp. enrichment culture]|uniref:DUF7848 domain-containing protein n=1 Tax=Streptomyces sp. enrichment culture TaxID=1795815 RepID=UPI003F549394